MVVIVGRKIVTFVQKGDRNFLGGDAVIKRASSEISFSCVFCDYDEAGTMPGPPSPMWQKIIN